MLSYLKRLIEDVAGNPRSYAFINITSALSLQVGFLSCTLALILGRTVSEGIILGLASCLVVLSGHNYRVAKNNEKVEPKPSDEEDSPKQ